MSLVRARSRSRVVGRVLMAGGGIGLVAAAVLLAAMLRPPGPASSPDAAPDPVIADISENPSIRDMHAAASIGGVDRAVPLSSMGAAQADPPVRAGALRSGKVAIDLLQK